MRGHSDNEKGLNRLDFLTSKLKFKPKSKSATKDSTDDDYTKDRPRTSSSYSTDDSNKDIKSPSSPKGKFRFKGADQKFSPLLMFISSSSLAAPVLKLNQSMTLRSVRDMITTTGTTTVDSTNDHSSRLSPQRRNEHTVVPSSTLDYAPESAWRSIETNSTSTGTSANETLPGIDSGSEFLSTALDSLDNAVVAVAVAEQELQQQWKREEQERSLECKPEPEATVKQSTFPSANQPLDVYHISHIIQDQPLPSGPEEQVSFGDTKDVDTDTLVSTTAPVPTEKVAAEEEETSQTLTPSSQIVLGAIARPGWEVY